MGAAYFYHLTRRPLETTLAVLLEKSLAAGWRVAVRGRDSDRLGWLDQKLWLGTEDGFLPHGLEGGPHDADQPVLLTRSATPANKPTCIISVDGADITPEETRQLDRVSVLFDGTDPTAVETARNQWRLLTGAGCAAQYWSEDTGKWEMKAEKAEASGD